MKHTAICMMIANTQNNRKWRFVNPPLRSKFRCIHRKYCRPAFLLANICFTDDNTGRHDPQSSNRTCLHKHCTRAHHYQNCWSNNSAIGRALRYFYVLKSLHLCLKIYIQYQALLKVSLHLCLLALLQEHQSSLRVGVSKARVQCDRLG